MVVQRMIGNVVSSMYVECRPWISARYGTIRYNENAVSISRVVLDKGNGTKMKLEKSVR